MRQKARRDKRAVLAVRTMKKTLCLAMFGLVAMGALRYGVARSNAPLPATSFNGNRAFEDLKRLAAFGPRPSGSPAQQQARAWMVQQIKQAGCQVERDEFTASTPAGNVRMVNLIAKIPGRSPEVVMLAGHYDTKRFSDFKFVGANDGGSSAALLLEMARVLGRRKNPQTYWLVFFDGEEAVDHWTDSDSLYGSRHLESQLASSGKLSRIRAMILVDMIGDARLDIRQDMNSTPWLTKLAFQTASRLGYGKEFVNQQTAIQDDHIPFVNAGVSAVDLIDLDYGPENRYWHSVGDTVDHCSAQSLTIVGRVVETMLASIASSPEVTTLK